MLFIPKSYTDDKLPSREEYTQYHQFIYKQKQKKKLLLYIIYRYERFWKICIKILSLQFKTDGR